MQMQFLPCHLLTRACPLPPLTEVLLFSKRLSGGSVCCHFILWTPLSLFSSLDSQKPCQSADIIILAEYFDSGMKKARKKGIWRLHPDTHIFKMFTQGLAERQRDRHTERDNGCLPSALQSGLEPTPQVCALTGNPTGNLLVQGPHPTT